MLRIEKPHIDEMIAHARDEYPDECCGFLAGTNSTSTKLYRIANVHSCSRTRFEMSVQEHINARRDWERNGWDIIAIYHSHPNGMARPSQIDVRMTIHGGWWDVFHILVSLEDQDTPRIRAFVITRRGDIVEQDFEVTQES